MPKYIPRTNDGEIKTPWKSLPCQCHWVSLTGRFYDTATGRRETMWSFENNETYTVHGITYNRLETRIELFKKLIESFSRKGLQHNG